MKFLLSTLLAAGMASMLIFVRIKATKKPTSLKKIILPPIFMSTGMCMYFAPQFRLTPVEILEAICLGMFFSIFLVKTSKFEVVDKDIYLKRSKAFVFILIGLLIVRIILKVYLSVSINVSQLSGMFFLLAFSMIVPWRLAMYRSYKKLAKQMQI
ncbi:cytochrome c biogenesis protein CcdC [Bacillus sp. RG28]|uniref:Cytochrome c biogenesis protein CcdC n=1 Tax=Gottfriedia endophytica TaxID=2820819 RepID=A0A940NPG9_9BACI|nr:cytochrome c biogenesis protein CcdC [Gottfriedia endophytica]MBP0725924.1 cytochrome c biogenesis protein CcdC [Gottfriedia endophytica]